MKNAHETNELKFSDLCDEVYAYLEKNCVAGNSKLTSQITREYGGWTGGYADKDAKRASSKVTRALKKLETQGRAELKWGHGREFRWFFDSPELRHERKAKSDARKAAEQSMRKIYEAAFDADKAEDLSAGFGSLSNADVLALLTSPAAIAEAMRIKGMGMP